MRFYPGDEDRAQRMSLVEEDPPRSPSWTA